MDSGTSSATKPCTPVGHASCMYAPYHGRSPQSFMDAGDKLTRALVRWPRQLPCERKCLMPGKRVLVHLGGRHLRSFWGVGDDLIILRRFSKPQQPVPELGQTSDTAKLIHMHPVCYRTQRDPRPHMINSIQVRFLKIPEPKRP